MKTRNRFVNNNLNSSSIIHKIYMVEEHLKDILKYIENKFSALEENNYTRVYNVYNYKNGYIM